MNEQKFFLAHDDVANTCQFAATIARSKFYGLGRDFVPPPSSATATVSFVEIDESCYAVTARHVIQNFKDLASEEGKQYEGYLCLQDPGVAIGGPFLTPPGTLTEPEPDIAICPIKNELCTTISKKPFRVLAKYDAIWPVEYAVATGFPTEETHDQIDAQGRLVMGLQCIQAVSEGIGSRGSSDQIQFHSELEQNLKLENLSGLSGGPVFWSNGRNYGLLGFVKEALSISSNIDGDLSDKKSRIHFLCQRTDYEILRRWTRYVETNWQAERDKINAAISSKIK